MHWITITDRNGNPLRINLDMITHTKYDKDGDLCLYFAFSSNHNEATQEYIYLTAGEIAQFDHEFAVMTGDAQ